MVSQIFEYVSGHFISIISTNNNIVICCFSVLNANMRRIDLCCKLLAPALTGVILQYSGPFTTTVIIAAWNIVSFFGELGLLIIVYKLVPSLSIKKLRKSVVAEDNNIEVDDTESIEVCNVLFCINFVAYFIVYLGHVN